MEESQYDTLLAFHQLISEESVNKIINFISELDSEIYIDTKEQNIKHLQLYLTTKTFSSLLYTQGVEFLSGLLYYYQTEDEFENCIEIKNAIEEHNDISGDNIQLKNYTHS